MESASERSEREVVIKRELKAPRGLVYRMWTEGEHVQRWWGPDCFTNPVCEIDARTGGRWRIVMRGPDGSEHECGGIYRVIVPNRKIVFTNNVVDHQGAIVLEGVTTVDLEDDGDGTRLTVTTRAKALQPIGLMMLQGMEPGWAMTIEHLARMVEREVGA